MKRQFSLLERTSHHVSRRVDRQEMRKQYRRARAYAMRFAQSGNLPCGYQDHYGDQAEAEGMEARAMGMAYMIHHYGGCKKFAQLCESMVEDFGGGA